MSKKQSKKNIKQNKVKPDNWDELKDVGLMTFLDIHAPHQIVSDMMVTFKDIMDKDPTLKDLCQGLDKSYYDCFDKCLNIMSKHVVSENFPKTHKELLENQDAFNFAVFKTGEVGKGIEDKNKLLEETLTYQNLHAQYHELAHHISALTVKGKTEVEQRLIATQQIDKKAEEVEQEHNELMNNLNMAKESIEASKTILKDMETIQKMS